MYLGLARIRAQPLQHAVNQTGAEFLYYYPGDLVFGHLIRYTLQLVLTFISRERLQIFYS